MIIAYLQGTRSHQVVESFYEHILELIHNGDPIACGMLSTTRIYNAILMAFGRFSRALPMGPQVIETMLKDAAQTPDPSHNFKTTLPPPRSPLPDVRTWTILLNTFMLHRQPRAAEKVLELMTARGIEPNITTWNSLAGGYAQMQDTVNAVEVVARLEKAGLQADENTMQRLARIKDRRALVATMKKKEEREAKSQEQAEVEERTLEALRQTMDVEQELNGDGLLGKDEMLLVREIETERVSKGE